MSAGVDGEAAATATSTFLPWVREPNIGPILIALPRSNVVKEMRTLITTTVR
jgi:hypothetical protein